MAGKPETYNSFSMAPEELENATDLRRHAPLIQVLAGISSRCKRAKEEIFPFCCCEIRRASFSPLVSDIREELSTEEIGGSLIRLGVRFRWAPENPTNFPCPCSIEQNVGPSNETPTVSLRL